jgi:acetoin utilization deacetylase AcuC-like enzyme
MPRSRALPGRRCGGRGVTPYSGRQHQGTRREALVYDSGVIRIVTDSRCLGHQAPPGYPERPERLAGILEHLRREGLEIDDRCPSGLSETLPAPSALAAPAPTAPGRQPALAGQAAPAAPAALAVRTAPAPSALAELAALAALAAVTALHAESYVQRFHSAVARGDTLLDSADNPLSDGVWAAAWAAVEATLAAADWVAGDRDRVGFAAVRPPGHHAEAAMAMGFCYFNNVAIAAEHLRRRHGADRVAIFDFDVHHGNGTQHLFEDRPDVLYASTHQYPFYPGTGAAEEVGVGAGVGATLNLPLPAGTGDEGYAAAIEGRVLPELRRFAPDVLLLSAGFDAWRRDPLGGMAVSEDAFARWGAWLRRLASEVCGGRILAVLEGGYDLRQLPRLVSAHLQGLASG